MNAPFLYVIAGILGAAVIALFFWLLIARESSVQVDARLIREELRTELDRLRALNVALEAQIALLKLQLSTLEQRVIMLVGATGAQGAAGVAGATGQTGAVGAQGVPGAPGKE